MGDFADIFSNTRALVLVILFFGGSIFVHELGHFFAARLRGLKILRFSIGFGPRIFSWRGGDGCEYILSLLPLGGYVALPQLADMGALEGGDGNGETEKLPKASCTDKIIVSAAGAFFNVLFAVLLAAIIWCVGITKNAAAESTVVGFVPEKISDVEGNQFPCPAKLAGVRAGDKIISIDGRTPSDFQQIIELVAIGSGRTADGKPLAKLEVERDGKILKLDVPARLIKTNPTTGDEIRMIGISPAMRMFVGKILENSPAKAAGLRDGDEVAEIDGQKLYSNAQLGAYLDSLKDGTKTVLGVVRDGKKIEVTITPKRVALTKELLKIEAPAGDGAVSFILSNRQNPNSKTGLPRVFSVKRGAAAFDKIGVGDALCYADGKPADSLEELGKIADESAARLALTLSDTAGQIYDVVLPAGVKSAIEPPKTRAMLGYMLRPELTTVHPSILEQFSDSIVRTYNALSSLANPKSDVGIKSLAGPVDIGRVIYKLSMTDFILVLSFAVLLNVNLAILNILPIPVLDGGHILFAIVEKLRGKPLPTAVFATVQGIFSLLLLSLMAFVVYYGFLRWSGDTDLENSAQAVSEYYIKDIKF